MGVIGRGAQCRSRGGRQRRDINVALPVYPDILMLMQHLTAAQLKEWRAEIGVSQAVAARALGVSRRTMAAWEGGERPVPRIAIKAVPEAARRIRRSRIEADSRARRKRREAYRERQAALRAERARLRRGGGSKGPAWW